MAYTYKVPTHTCFGTVVPSSGSLRTQWTPSPTDKSGLHI